MRLFLVIKEEKSIWLFANRTEMVLENLALGMVPASKPLLPRFSGGVQKGR